LVFDGWMSDRLQEISFTRLGEKPVENVHDKDEHHGGEQVALS
jgi:hypothetical protein